MSVGQQPFPGNAPPPGQQAYPNMAPPPGQQPFPGAAPQPGYAAQNQQGYPPQQQQGFPPQQTNSGYPPQQQQGFPPQQPNSGYPPHQQQGFPPQQANSGYPPPQQQQGFPPQHGSDALSQGQIQVQPMPQPGQQPPPPPQQQQQPAQSSQPFVPGEGHDNGPGFKWDNTPDSDPDEDGPEKDDDGPQKPTDDFDALPGYESISFDAGPSIPPPVYVPPTEDAKPEETFTSPDALSEDAVRDAILTFVDKHCCYGSKPAKEMKFNNIAPSSALHYQLETYTEARTTRRAHRPYRNEYVDGPHCGMAPPPWAMECQPTSMFHDHTQILEVPHTSTIRICFRCTGRGFLRCGRCYGRGRVRCGSCHGRGNRRVRVHDHWENRTCYSCHGSGRKRCFRCGGDGRVTCHTCDGWRSLRHFIELVVNFTNHLSDYILEGTDMPDELIRDVSGQVIFEQSLPYVWPISQYTVQQINENSIRIVGAHRQAWPTDRTLMQRQVLRSVPVSEVAYTWKEHNTRFWVYGYEHEVYAPDYPHQCCWGCNVL